MENSDPSVTPSAEHQVSQAREHFDAGRISQAVELASDAVKQTDSCAAAWYLLAQVAQMRGDLDKAVELVRKALLEAADDANAYTLLGTLQIAQGKEDFGERNLQEALSHDPECVQALIQLGMLAMRRNQLETANEHLQKALAIDRHNADIYHNLGVLAAHAQLFEDAKLFFQHAIDIDPKVANSHNNLGMIEMKLGYLTAAKQCFDRALMLDPKSADPHNNLGNLAQQQGDAQAALSHYLRAVEINPKHVESLFNVGNHFIAQQDPIQAVMYLLHAIEIDDNFFLGKLGLGIALYQIFEYHQARQVLEDALKLNPTSWEALTFLAESELQIGRYAAAKDHFFQASQIKINDPDLLTGMACSFIQLKQYQAAIECLDKAEQLRPNDFETHLLLCQVYLVTGDLRNHNQMCEKISRLDFKPCARPLLQWLEVLNSDPRLALARQAYAKWQQAAILTIAQQLPALVPTANNDEIKVGYLLPEKEAPDYYALLEALMAQEKTLKLYQMNPVQQKSDLDDQVQIQDLSHLDVRARAAKLKADGISILIDCDSGHSFAKMATLALQPCPVICQAAAASLIHDNFYYTCFATTEYELALQNNLITRAQPLKLKDVSCQYLYHSQAHALPHIQVPADCVVLACFAPETALNYAQLTEWAAWLSQNEKVKLWLGYRPYSRQGLCELFANHNIREDQLIFSDIAVNLETAAAVVDIYLDPTTRSDPYHGLWAIQANLPTLSQPGSVIHSRTTAGKLLNLGLGDWIAGSRDQAAEMVDKLIRYPDIRQGLSAQLQASQAGGQAPAQFWLDLQQQLLEKYRDEGQA